jgi:hypothetical protein
MSTSPIAHTCLLCGGVQPAAFLAGAEPHTVASSSPSAFLAQIDDAPSFTMGTPLHSLRYRRYDPAFRSQCAVRLAAKGPQGVHELQEETGVPTSTLQSWSRTLHPLPRGRWRHPGAGRPARLSVAELRELQRRADERRNAHKALTYLHFVVWASQLRPGWVPSISWARRTAKSLRFGVRQTLEESTVEPDHAEPSHECSDLEKVEAVRTLWRAVDGLRADLQLTLSQIFNIDETSIPTGAPAVTLERTSHKGPSVVAALKHGKRHVTGLMTARADGVWGPSALIFNKLSTSSRSLPKAAAATATTTLQQSAGSAGFSLGVYGSESGWLNSEVLAAFFADVGPLLSALAPVLLLWDNCRAHISEDMMPTLKRLLQQKINCYTLVANMTYTLQPLDRAVFRRFKASIRRLMLADSLQDEDKYLSLSLAEWRVYVVQLVTRAMLEVLPEQLQRGFIGAGFSAALDGSQDHLVGVVLRSGLRIDRAEARRVEHERAAVRAGQAERDAEAARQRALHERERQEAERAAAQLGLLERSRAHHRPSRYNMWFVCSCCCVTGWPANLIHVCLVQTRPRQDGGPSSIVCCAC